MDGEDGRSMMCGFLRKFSHCNTQPSNSGRVHAQLLLISSTPATARRPALLRSLPPSAQQPGVTASEPLVTCAFRGSPLFPKCGGWGCRGRADLTIAFRPSSFATSVIQSGTFCSSLIVTRRIWMLSPLAEASVTGQASRRDARAEGRCASKALSPLSRDHLRRRCRASLA